MSAAALLGFTRGFAQKTTKTPFRFAVINDEISDDLDHACHVVAVDFGLSWIELRNIWGKNIANLDEAEIRRAKTIVDKYHLRVTDIASPLFKTDFPAGAISGAAPKHDAFGAGFTYAQQGEVLERGIHLAKSFDTERIRCFDFTRLADPKPYRAAINEDLRKAAAACAKNSLILAIENENTCNTAKGAEAAALLASIASPNFMLNWDPGNAAAAGEIPFPNGYELLPKNRIGHCHCKDAVKGADGKIAWAPVGGGMIDWVGQLKAFKQQNYHFGLSLETHWRGAGTPEASTRQSMAGLRNALAAAGCLS